MYFCLTYMYTWQCFHEWIGACPAWSLSYHLPSNNSKDFFDLTLLYWPCKCIILPEQYVLKHGFYCTLLHNMKLCNVLFKLKTIKQVAVSNTWLVRPDQISFLLLGFVNPILPYKYYGTLTFTSNWKNKDVWTLRASACLSSWFV